MLFEKVKESLNKYKAGTFVSVSWESDITSAKAKKENILILKESKCLARTKINYRNLKSNRDKEFSNVHHHSWFEHTNDKGIVQSKSNPNKKYIQLFPIFNRESYNVRAFVNNIPMDISLEEAYNNGWINKSTLNSNNSNRDVLIVSVDNIKCFGSEL